MHKKEQVMQDMLVEKHLFLLDGGVAHGPKGENALKKEN